MNYDAAIAAMQAGNKVTHQYFTSDEYIYMTKGRIISEDGVVHGTPADFLALRNASFLSDWELYTEN